MEDQSVSPLYVAYKSASSREKIADRRQARRDKTPDQLSREIEMLRRNQANDQSKIAELEEFRRGMNGDENIKVDDNKITWVGKVNGGISEFDPVVLDVCVGGVPQKSTFLYDGFRDP
jgi:hypothetical protein